MNKKFLIIIPFIVVGILVLSTISDEPDNKTEPPFHVTLASPSQYNDGVYSSQFNLEQGEYSFRFVPNGDSPQNLTINLKGEDFEFEENFKLKGTLHETGISEYYTWDYEGEKLLNVLSSQVISIQINPNGNLLGSVSVDIIEN